MKQQIIDRFPGISCALADAAGKETTEYYGFANVESHCFPADDDQQYIQ
ncbi:MAG: hypothetical protein IJ153_09975 [Clostridia bacterium]|nr:hypothetical protein [Clostridia bacterium]